MTYVKINLLETETNSNLVLGFNYENDIWNHKELSTDSEWYQFNTNDD